MRNAQEALTGPAAIAASFARARAERRAALITYLTAGYPSPGESPALFRALEQGGADILEMGVPFSDPIADGPAIQRASYAALQKGVTPLACLNLVRRLRQEGIRLPIILMGYYNPIYRYGLTAYAKACREAGVDGLIVPDVPLEEAGPLQEACRACDLALILLAAPTTREERLRRIAEETEGFLYLVARLGITGAGNGLAEDLQERIALARRLARVPVAVGFGIATPEQARALAAWADGVIVGSAIVERAPQGPAALAQYIAGLRAALRPA
ncbi:MAG: tryptophan synthase subunit alpha [Chloroflexi bacterium]|nr:tryptophan synthase subunit alpha [Chloroflexota bacterium]